MTAPRLREQCRPPSPPDRLPSPRGGHPSSQTALAAGRRAGFARLAGSVRTLAAAACLSLVGALLLPATVQAQDSDEVLLSNTGQDWEAGAGTNVSSAIVWVQGFTTGSNADGYHLSSIELNVERVPNTTADVTIALWSATSDSRPDALGRHADPFHRHVGHRIQHLRRPGGYGAGHRHDVLRAYVLQQ